MMWTAERRTRLWRTGWTEGALDMTRSGSHLKEAGGERTRPGSDSGSLDSDQCSASNSEPPNRDPSPTEAVRLPSFLEDLVSPASSWREKERAKIRRLGLSGCGLSLHTKLPQRHSEGAMKTFRLCSPDRAV